MHESQTWVSRDFPRTFPMPPSWDFQVPMVISNQYEFSNVSHNSYPAWEDLLPHRTALVRLGPPAEHRRFVPAAFHSLHCLQMIRAAFDTPIIQGDALWTHVPHCANYVRQSILCHADSTLEEVNPIGYEHGVGVLHMCKDWSALREAVEDNFISTKEEYLSN